MAQNFNFFAKIKKKKFRNFNLKPETMVAEVKFRYIKVV